MQIVVNRQDLLTVLKRSGAAIKTKDLVSIRMCLLIVATAQGITFATTDGQIDIVIDGKGEVRQEGRAVLNHHRLSAIVNELPDGFVEISVDGKLKVSIKTTSSKRKFSMSSMDPVDFPSVLSPDQPPPMYVIESKILLQGISEVLFAAADPEDTSLPSGALLVPSKEKLFHLVALNGYEMAMATGWFVEKSSGEECLIPRNVLDALKGIPKDHVIALSKNDNKIFANAPGLRIRANQAWKPFPEVWKQTPQGLPEKRRWRVSSEAFLESVRAVSAGSDIVEGKDSYIQIDVTSSEGTVTLATRKSETGQGEDELAVTDTEPGSFKFHVNAGSLAKALKSFVPTEIDFYYDIIFDRPTLYLKNETLLATVMLIAEVSSPPPKEKK